VKEFVDQAFKYEPETPPSPRPDIVDLLSPWFDRPKGEPATKTLIICAAPRSGSYELARLLTAAGIGTPHEYFHPTCAAVLAARWGLPSAVLSEQYIAHYIEELRCRRSQNDVFGTKLQYWQYEDSLRNEQGCAIFDRAVVVHLYRADAVSQFVSWHKACESGRFDFSDRQTHPPRDPKALQQLSGLLGMIDQLVMEDANFRRLFVLAGIRPIFCEFNQLSRDPQSVLEKIADALGAAVNQEGLARMIKLGGPYHRAERADREKILLEKLATCAFKK
jgi:trehalose 2-sulfotransferase